jgi:hypothetical protein
MAISAEERKAMMIALGRMKEIIEGIYAREQQEAETAKTTGYPAKRLTRRS